MAVTGYVVLKLNKTLLYYADWTNTRRKYKLREITAKTSQDLRRLFNGSTVVLIVDKKKTLWALTRILGKLDTSQCVEVKNVGTVSQILTFYLDKHKKKKSYYNYQRDHWLSILSVINIHLMLNRWMTKDQILKIIQHELLKHNRDISPDVLFEKFMKLDLYSYNDSMISLPQSKMALTLG